MKATVEKRTPVFMPYAVVITVESQAEHEALRAITARNIMLPNFFRDRGELGKATAPDMERVLTAVFTAVDSVM